MGEIRYLFTLAEGIVSRLIRLSLSKGNYILDTLLESDKVGT